MASTFGGIFSGTMGFIAAIIVAFVLCIGLCVGGGVFLTGLARQGQEAAKKARPEIESKPTGSIKAIPGESVLSPIEPLTGSSIATSQEPISLPEPRITEVQPKQAADRQPASKLRTWRDASDQFSIEAEYGGTLNGLVSLKTSDGQTKKIALKKLSEEDQEWIKNRAKRR